MTRDMIVISSFRFRKYSDINLLKSHGLTLGLIVRFIDYTTHVVPHCVFHALFAGHLECWRKFLLR